MNTDSADCTRLPYPFPNDRELKVGEFCWSKEINGVRYLHIVLPGSIRPDSIRCSTASPTIIQDNFGPVWGWDGNEDKPTLSPSLHWPGQWHGHLVAGRLVSC